MSKPKNATYCKWCKKTNPPEADFCGYCGAMLPWPRNQYIAFIASFSLFLAGFVSSGFVADPRLIIPLPTRLLFVSLFDILGFLLTAYFVKTLPERGEMKRGGWVLIILGVLVSISDILVAIYWRGSA